MKMKDKTYDKLKWIALVLIPPLILFLSTVLGLFNVDGQIISIVTGVLSATATFIGSVVKMSSDKYWSENLMDNLYEEDLDGK